MSKTLLVLSLSLACSANGPPPDSRTSSVRQAEATVDCSVGSDATAVVQAAMSAGTCLPPGDYPIDMAPLGATGRRRDAMLSGGTLCGVKAGGTTVRFRGDAGALLWEGIADAHVHDVTLDSSCVTDTIEQTHLVRLTSGHWIHDVRLVHPRRATLAGDAVNVVGSQTSPMTGLAIDHVDFASCARFGVQISRGVQGGRISDSSFGPGCGIGSEGSGAIDGLVLSHDTFESDGSTAGLALDIQRQTNLLATHLTIHGHGIFLFMCDSCAVEHTSVDSLVSGLSGDVSSAISVNDVAHHVRITDVTLVQDTTLASPAVKAGPLRPNRQADLADITVDSSTLTQLTGAPFVSAVGVTGVAVTGNSLSYGGPAGFVPVSLFTAASPAVSPAVSVPTTGVTEAGNTSTAVAAP